MGKNVLFLLSILVVITLFSCTIKRQKATYATYVEHRSYVRGGDDYWEFYYNGKRYKVIGWCPTSKVIGEKYKIIYDSLQPGGNYEIDNSMPLFIPEEHIGKTIGIIIEDNVCVNSKKYKTIGFEYHVNGRNYQTSQTIPPRKDPLCLKIGDKFEVEYWQENPKRVIIYLDKPIK